MTLTSDSRQRQRGVEYSLGSGEAGKFRCPREMPDACLIGGVSGRPGARDCQGLAEARAKKVVCA